MQKQVTLVYASKIQDIEERDLYNILTTARSNNRNLGVTGILYYKRNFFLQCLEGERDKVNILYNKIALDKRHTDLMILYYNEIDSRLFKEWDMGYIAENDINAQLLGPDGIFNPYLLSAKDVYEFLLKLAKIIRD